MLGIIPSDCYPSIVIILHQNGFFPDNPGFSAPSDVSQVATQDSATPPPPSGSSSSASVPSLGESSRHNCLQCRRRMSKTVFDCHTVCHKCLGYDCLIDKRCDKCLDWSREEIEAYVKLRNSPVSKDKRGKESLPKPPSSQGPIQPSSPSVNFSVSGVDDRISSQLTEFSASFDHKLAALQAVIMNSFSSLQTLDLSSMSARMSNVHSFAAPLELPVPGLSHGLDPSLLNPESTVSFNREFQVDSDDRVPSGFWTPFPVDQGESLVTDRSIGSLLCRFLRPLRRFLLSLHRLGLAHVYILRCPLMLLWPPRSNRRRMMTMRI